MMDGDVAPYDEREVYEAQIKPLIEKIFAICKDKNIPVMMYFQVAVIPGRGVAYSSTVRLEPDRADHRMYQAYQVMQPSGEDTSAKIKMLIMGLLGGNSPVL